MASGKTIVITGASAGIGRHAALALALRGHSIFATARRLAALEQLRDEAPKGSILPLRLDVDDAASIADAVAEIDRLTEGRGVDVLVNNAGFATAGALAELSDEDLRAQFETNVFGLMSVTRALLPAMMNRRSGRIVNISSVSGRIPAPILGAYHATKYALEALSDALRMELDPFGIQVVVVEPGTIKTGFAARTISEATRARAEGSQYAAIYSEVDNLAARFEGVAVGPAPVTRAIVRAIEARRPHARYVAPWRFLALIALIRALPTRWIDFAMRRTFGLTPDRLRITAASAKPDARSFAAPKAADVGG
jgi:short-subunit dehydrogenase